MGHRHRRRPLLVLLLGLTLLLGLSTALLPPASPPPKARGPAAVATPPPPTTCGAPLTPPPREHRPHQDSALDRLLIGLLADKLAELVQEGGPSSSSSPSSSSKRARPASFQEFALSTKALLAPRSADDLMTNQNAAGDAHLLRRSRQIAATLAGLVPLPLRVLFRATGQSRWACEAHALLAPLVSGWLVGPATRVEGEIEFNDDGGRRREVWTSSTKIERCRYFAESGCRKSCVYLCKIPTQAFFAETLGTPLTLTPDFEDGSCVMAFGQLPLPLDDDPVIQMTRAMGSCCGSMAPAAPVPREEGGEGNRASL